MEKEIVLSADGKIIRSERRLLGLRRMIGQKMKESLSQAPQATITTEADMSGLLALKESYSKKNIKISFTDLFIKVASKALELNPTVNSSLQDGKIYEYESVNIGVAVGTDDALYVPIIRDTQDKDIEQLSIELKEIVNKIKERKISSDNFIGGTFTISNLGMFGVDYSTPIINTPEAAILGIGRTQKKLMFEDDDTIKIKPMTNLSLTFDHSVIDGVPAARFLETVVSIMENPTKFF